MSEPTVPDPFKSAQRLAGINVHLRPEDIMTALPDMRRETAQRLMDRHGGTLAAAMLGAGITAAIEIMRQEGGGT